MPVDPNVDLTATPFDQVRLMTGEMFFRRLARLLKDNPPYPADSEMMTKLKLLGIEPGQDLDPRKLDPQVRKGINAAPWNVWKLLAEGPYTMPAVNGWLNITTSAVTARTTTPGRSSPTPARRSHLGRLRSIRARSSTATDRHWTQPTIT